MDLAFLRTLFSPFAGKVLLAGFSGGADSTAALLCTQAAAQELSFSLIAVHMNHHLRGAESDREARDAKRFAEERGIPFEEIHLHVALGNGMEERARQARLAAWKKLTSRYPGSAVVTGHHAGDRAENLLLRLGRGVNLSGAVGLRMRSEVDGVTFLRPLYHWTREMVEAFLRERGITSWAEDSSNAEEITPRNVLRKRILPELYALYPGRQKGMILSLDLWERDAEFLEDCARERLASPRVREAAFWAETPEVLLGRMLRFAWEARGDAGDFSRQTIERVRKFLQSGRSGIIPLGNQRQLMVFRGKLSFLRETPSLPPFLWNWKKSASCRIGAWCFTRSFVTKREGRCGDESVFFPQEALPEELLLAFPLPGEKMIPFGRKNPVSLKGLRVKAHCPAAMAPPALRTSDGEILWLPGIRRSALFPVEKADGIVKFSAVHDPNDGQEK